MVLGIVATALGAHQVPAFAQTAEPLPIIGRSPTWVRFGASASISGHLQGGDPGANLELRRRGRDGVWRLVATAAVNEALAVEFRLSDLKSTAAYRLTYTDPVSAQITTSDPERIFVAPVPVIGRASSTVGYKRTATITGHLKGGTDGQRVRLQRRKVDGQWTSIKRKSVDGAHRVAFRVFDPTKTASYRLFWSRPLLGAHTSSGVARIRVRARLTLSALPTDVMASRRVILKGRLYPRASGRSVVLRWRVGGEWRRIARVRAGDGTYRRSFTPSRGLGSYRVQARFLGDKVNTAVARRRRLRIYRRALATWYGPGFYGRRTACGGILHTDTLGVAHRQLDCGTDVSILYKGRSITVPVIDRGPYSSADWDLTGATARRLGFEGKTHIGVIP